MKPTKEARIEFRRTQRWVHLVAWFVATAGLIDILEAFSLKEPRVIEWMEEFLPLDVSESSRLGMYLSGFCLLAIARGVCASERLGGSLSSYCR